eukprot:scaffold72509_cov60-Phaeocystis_antarctica.AAC.4
MAHELDCFCGDTSLPLGRALPLRGTDTQKGMVPALLRESKAFATQHGISCALMAGSTRGDNRPARANQPRSRSPTRLSMSMACTMAMACGLLTTGPRLAPHRSSVVFMTAAGGDASEQQGVEAKSVARVELLAANEDRSAVGRLSPGGGRAEQQQYVGVPPPGSGVQPVEQTMIGRVRAPFIGLTLTACVAIAGWQSKRVYKERQQGLLEEFGATMAAYLGEEREMASTLKLFRGQLGPGSHTVPMFVAFLKQAGQGTRTRTQTQPQTKPQP